MQSRGKTKPAVATLVVDPGHLYDITTDYSCESQRICNRIIYICGIILSGPLCAHDFTKHFYCSRLSQCEQVDGSFFFVVSFSIITIFQLRFEMEAETTTMPSSRPQRFQSESEDNTARKKETQQERRKKNAAPECNFDQWLNEHVKGYLDRRS